MFCNAESVGWNWNWWKWKSMINITWRQTFSFQKLPTRIAWREKSEIIFGIMKGNIIDNIFCNNNLQLIMWHINKKYHSYIMSNFWELHNEKTSIIIQIDKRIKNRNLFLYVLIHFLNSNCKQNSKNLIYILRDLFFIILLCF